MPTRLCLAVALSLLLAACGGHSGTNGPTPVQAPTAPRQLTLTQSGADTITLNWLPPQISGSNLIPDFDGYNLELKIGSGAYQTLNTTLIPRTDAGANLTFSPTAPDNTTYTFRLQAVKGSTPSPYSNEVSCDRGPNTPGQATASYDWNTGAMNLSWARNTDSSDGLRIERAECDGSGNPTTGWINLPITDFHASSYSDGAPPRDRYCTYRVSNLKGSLAGQPSPSSSPVFAGLPAPAWVDAAYDPIQSVAKISWASSTSAQPDGIRLERSDCDINGTLLGNWVTLPTPSGYSTSFLDQSIQEGGRYAYRVSNLFGAKDSAPCQMNRFISIPLFAPSNFQVIATAGGLQLTWQNRSLTATQLLIQRGPGQSISADTTTIATLSPTTSAYLDPIANLGYYTYVVVAKNSTGAMPSSSVTAATLNPLGALALAATPLNAPPEVDAALRPNGNWAFASAAPFGIPSMNDPWAASIPTTPGRWSDPAIRIDRQGWPHAVYATPDPNTTGGSTLLHMWYDGAVWKSEPMVNVMLPPSPSSNLNQGWTFQLDSTGTPQLLVDHATTSDPLGWTSASLSYLHKVNGAWIEEYLDVLNPAVTNLGGIRLALDEADTPHVLIIYGQNAIDYVRTAVRVWSSTTLPTAADSAGSYGFLDGLWIDGNNGWIFEENGIVGGNGLNVIQKKDGLWQSLQALGTRPFDSNYGGAARCVISPDRTRVAILYATSMGTKLYHLTSAGWHETLVAPPTPPGSAATRWIGFDSNQKLHVLLPNGSNPDYTDFHE